MNAPETERDLRLVELLDQALSELRAGKPVDTVTWQGEFPDLSEDLPALLETMRDLDTAAASWKGAATLADARTRPAPPDDAPVPEAIGRYRVLGRIGAGGMGRVYKAHDPQLDRTVAIKVPRIDGGDRGPRVARFLREARAAAKVRHQHICPIHDVGEQDGLPYVVMAYVEGESLAERLARVGRYEDPRAAVALVRQVAAALQAVHDEGIVHRDLKPANVLLDTEGAAFLSDFGLARSGEPGEGLTIDGDLLGTPAYMPPEQASGQSDRVGPSSDIYSLGVVLYQMLTGRLPYEGPTTLGLLHRINTEAPPPPSRYRADLDPALEAILVRAMARRPEDRPASPKEFAAALDGWAQGAAPTATFSPAPVPSAVEPKVVELSGLPGGETLKLALPPGAKADVKVTMAGRGEGEGRKRRKKTSWKVTVSISLSVALLLLAVGVLTWPEVVLQHGESPGHVASLDGKGKEQKKEDHKSPGGKDRGGDKSGDDKPLDKVGLPAPPGGVDKPAVLSNAVRLTEREAQPTPGLYATTWTADSKQIAALSGDGSCVMFDASNGKEVKRMPREEGAEFFLRRVRDGGEIVTASESLFLTMGTPKKPPEIPLVAYSANNLGTVLKGKIEIRDLNTKRTVGWEVERGAALKAVALAPDAKRFAAGDAAGQVRIWDVAARKEKSSVRGHSARVRSVAFSPDGKFLASAGDDRTVKLWEAATGKPLHAVEKLPAAVLTLAFSPDGKLLACGDNQGVVRVWSRSPWKLIAVTRPAANEPVPSLAFSPDSASVLTANFDGTASVWSLPAGK